MSARLSSENCPKASKTRTKRCNAGYSHGPLQSCAFSRQPGRVSRLIRTPRQPAAPPPRPLQQLLG